jgi:hypothetical protein
MMVRSSYLAIVLFFTLLIGCAPPAPAQDVATITFAAVGIGWVALGVGSLARLNGCRREAVVGDTIRFDVASSGELQHRPIRVRGRLTSVSADSFVVTSVNGSTAHARADVVGMNVLLGREAKWAQGWVTGFVVGGSAPGMLGLVSGDDPPCDDCFTAGAKATLGAIVGGFTGSMIGAGVGAMMSGEHWARSSGVRSPTVGLTPMLGRSPGLIVRVAF